MGEGKKTEGNGSALTYNWEKLQSYLNSIPIWLWAILAVVTLIGFDVWTEGPLWRWLREEGTTKEPHGTTLRNLTLFLVAVVGLPLAIWRSIVAQRGLQNDRYQKSVDMLGSEVLATRMGGIYVLERLAKEDMKEYHIQIMDILCFFLQHPRPSSPRPNNTIPRQTSYPLPDTQETLAVIGRREPRQWRLEKKKKWQLNLSNAQLKGVKIADAYLEGANLTGADLRQATLWCAHLSRATLRNTKLNRAMLLDADMKYAMLEGAWLKEASLKGADLEGAILHHAHLDSADLTDAILKDVKYLTQAMLDKAAHRGPDGKPLPGPRLMGACCADSGEPLVWRDLPNP